MNSPLSPTDRKRAWAMPENSGPGSLEACVLEVITELGLKYQIHRDSRRDDVRGWPDLFVIGPAGCLWRELKAERGRLTPEQRGIGAMLLRLGLSWQVWRPTELINGTVRRQLEAIR